MLHVCVCNVSCLISPHNHNCNLYLEFLSSTYSKMEIIAITETSQKNNENFKSNVNIKGHATYYAPSHSNKGGNTPSNSKGCNTSSKGCNTPSNSKGCNTSSDSNKRGNALYVNEKLNIIERKDLKSQNDDYE